MEAKKIINSLQKRGLKGSIQRFRQGPQKVGLVDVWSFITAREVIEFNFEDFKKHKEGNRKIFKCPPEPSPISGMIQFKII